MSEKTAEEKLREELEGKLSVISHEDEAGKSDPVRKPVKPRAMRSRTAGRNTEKPVNVGQRVDSFMEDFERRIAESVRAGRAVDERKTAEKSSADLGELNGEENSEAVKRAAVKPVRHRRKKLDGTITPAKAGNDVLGLADIAESSKPEASPDSEYPAIEPEDIPEPGLPTPEPEATPEPELPAIEPEPTPEPELSTHEPEPTLEPEATPEPELSTHEPEATPEPEHPTHEQVATPEPEQPTPEPEATPEPEVTPEPELPTFEPEVTPEPEQPTLEQEITPESEQPTPEPEHPTHEQDGTPEPELPAIEQELTPEPELPAIEQELTPELGLPALEPEATPEPELPTPESELSTLEPEDTHEPEMLTPEPEDTPETEESAPDVQEIPDSDIDPVSQDEDSQNNIPIEIVNESEQEIDDEFPDIPVIDAQEIAESADNSEENSLPDIPVISPEPEDIDDNFTDFSKFDDNIDEFDEEPVDSSPIPENTTDFPPFADVVVNVDDDLPQISSEATENTSDDFSAEVLDPESEAAPVTVTMPESTKTAEDKLMANIAEAMTGSPLTLDKPDPSEPYRLPENLIATQNDPNFSPQSAEDKLIADISQAISESPIETAQNHANQNFEEDISPFDEMPLPEPIQTPDFDDTYEQDEHEDEEAGDDFDEPFLPDFSAKTEQQEQPQEEVLNEDFAGDFDAEGFSDLLSTNNDDNSDEVSDMLDHDNADTTEDFADPFSIDDDESLDSQVPAEEETEDFSELPVAEDDTAVDEDIPDVSELPDISLLDEPENDSEPVNLEKAPEPEPQPVTAEDRLAQELADFTNMGSTDDQQPDPEPEQSLLDELEPEHQEPQPSEEDSGEDFNFMDSWGDAANIMNYGDDEPESQEQQPDSHEQIPEPQDTFSQPEMPAPHFEPVTRITHAPQNFTEPDIPEVPKISPVWRILLQAVLGLLILAGVFSLFRLHQLTDNITAMMLYGSSPSGNSAQPYDYAVDRIPDEEISSRMRLRGIEGWKLVGSRRTQDTATGRYGYEFIFMRPTPGNP